MTLRGQNMLNDEIHVCAFKNTETEWNGTEFKINLVKV